MNTLRELELQRALLLDQELAIDLKLDAVRKQEYDAIREFVTPYFEDIKSSGIDIEVTRSAIYFKTQHPEKGYNEELFKIYMQENWSSQDPAFKGMEISYYTTTTNANDAWQVNRLVLLGQLATVVYEYHDEIVAGMNKVCESFQQAYRALYKEKRVLDEAKTEIKNNKLAVQTQVVTDLMKGDGVKFITGKNVDLKHNYCPRVVSLKFESFSKSGKTATVGFVLAYGEHVYKEEKCNVEKIIDQVIYYYKDIAEELLPQ